MFTLWVKHLQHKLFRLCFFSGSSTLVHLLYDRIDSDSELREVAIEAIEHLGQQDFLAGQLSEVVHLFGGEDVTVCITGLQVELSVLVGETAQDTGGSHVIVGADSDGGGAFQNVIGAQTGSTGVLQIIWGSLTSGERKTRVTYTPTEYNNISIDEEGFFYVTSTSIDEGAQYGAVTSKDNTYAPVKKLNATGTDIMARNGFWGPYGEVKIGTYSRDASAPSGVSKIIDAAAGPYGTWSIIDERRSRVYTYDSEGNCLFIFGEKGMKKGNLQSIEGIVYQGERMLLLDKMAKSITICNRTEYGDLLMTALQHNNERRYDLAVEDWETILQRNSNFDAAYIGIGDSYYRAGDWDTAMKYYKYAYDLNGYSEAFKLWRQDWLSKYIIVVPIVVIIVVWIGLKFFTYAAKVNKAASVKSGKKTYWEELLYG